MGIYHPLQVAGLPNSMFIDQLSDYLMDILAQHSNNIVVGDFNIHINDHNDVDVGLLLYTLSALGLNQKVSEAIHSKGNTIDLIFVEDTTLMYERLKHWSLYQIIDRWHAF